MCEYGYLVMAPEFHLGLCFIVSLHNPSKGCSRQYGKSGKLNMVPHARSKTPLFLSFANCLSFFGCHHLEHTGCLDPQKILSTIDAPPGVPGVSKNHIFFSTNETVVLLR